MKVGVRVLLFIGMLGIVLTFLGGKDVIKMSKDPISMESTDWGTLKAGDHVQVTIDMVWGQFYYETREESTFGIVTSSQESGRGYAIPHLFINNEGFYDIDYYIGLRLSNPSDYKVIEQVLAESDAWYYDTTGTVNYGMTTLYIDGTLEKMDSEEKQLMEEYLTECGYTPMEINQMLCPYMITRGNMAASKITLGIGIVLDLILLGVIGFMIYQHQKEKEQFSGHTYMGVSQTGSTDVYGGTNYGGNNFGGTNYGASKQNSSTYDGSTYGDNSYGGTNTYGQGSSYGATNTYGQSSSYGATDTYGQSNSYGATDTYGQSSSYGATDTYGQSNSYGATDTYGQSNSYGATDTYGQNSSYGVTDTYANNSTPVNNSSYGTTETSANEWPWQPKQ